MAVSPSNQIVPIDQALAPVRGMLAKNMKGIGAALGNYMAPERFLSAVMTLCRHNPDLADPRKASPASLLLSVLRVAHLQLSPDPALGQAWIIPRKGKAEFQLGYKGAIALAYRSPLVAAVRYGVVGQDDHFVWRDGKDWRLEHEPTDEGWPETMDRIRAAWAIIDLRSGYPLPRVMGLPEILRHKERGSGSQPAWQTDPAAMAVKTVLGDACRRGPFEGEIGRAFILDHLGEIGKGQPPATAEEESLIDLEPMPGEGDKPSDLFKRAHRRRESGTEGNLGGGDDDADDVVHNGAPFEPLAPRTILQLRAAAEAAGDDDCAGLFQEAARLCGSGNLEQVPAACEPELRQWIEGLRTGGAA